MDVNQNLHDALRVNGLNWEHVRDNLDIEDVSNEEHAAVKNFVSNVEDKSVEKIVSVSRLYERNCYMQTSPLGDENHSVYMGMGDMILVQSWSFIPVSSIAAEAESLSLEISDIHNDIKKKHLEEERAKKLAELEALNSQISNLQSTC